MTGRYISSPTQTSEWFTTISLHCALLLATACGVEAVVSYGRVGAIMNRPHCPQSELLKQLPRITPLRAAADKPSPAQPSPAQPLLRNLTTLVSVAGAGPLISGTLPLFVMLTNKTTQLLVPSFII